MHSNPTFWIPLLLLGAAHGLNPAMGWLLAVGLGLQQRSRRAMWWALGPMAFGHALAIAVVVVLAVALGLVIPVRVLRWLVAVVLLAFGVLHLLRHRHPRWGGMRVGARDLTIWSFLVATAHGAGLMVLPLVLGTTAPQSAHPHHHTGPSSAGIDGAAGVHVGHLLSVGVPPGQSAGLIAVVVHTLGYLLVTGFLAVIVYERLGLRMLRTAWVNLSVIWAVALIATAGFTLFL